MRLNETDRFYGMEDTSNPAPEIEQEYHIDQKDLIQRIEHFRRLVEMAWSKNSAHPDLRDDPDTHRFNALGQCAPSVRLLKDELLAAFPQLVLRSIHGRIENATADELASSHVWLEIPLKGDQVIIDVTPDQREAVGVDAPKVIMGLRSKLERGGYHYKEIEEDTDEVMRRSGSFNRYEFLRRRYDKVKENEAYYRELFDGNIFIVGSTATGKSELARGLEEQYPFEALDVGKLFRAVAYIYYNDTEPSAVKPDIEKIASGDQSEVDRVIGAIGRKMRLLNKMLLDETQLVKRQRGEQRVMMDGKDITDELDTRDMNVLVSTIAQSEQVRAIIWKWINRFSKDHGQIILTGHTLRDIDSTQFKVVHLTVDDDVAAKRLYDRSSGTYTSPDEALAVLQQRNQKDHMRETEALLDKVHMVDALSTDQLSREQVRFRALRRLVTIAAADTQRRHQQTEVGIEREQFEWQVNPFLAYIRESGKEIFQAEAALFQEQGVTEFDVAIQTMMHLSGRPITEIWLATEPLVLVDIENVFRSGNIQEASLQFSRCIQEGRITLNVTAVQEEARRQAERVLTIYAASTLPAAYMGNPERSPFKEVSDPKVSKSGSQQIRDPHTNETILRVREAGSGKNIVVKKVPPDVSDLYGKGFHYLHSGRADEAVAYGAYVEGEELPFAWVSYSAIDRGYKKDILRHLKVEPHRVLEMTRAWNATWSPKNTMSVLFSFAHDQIRADSRRQVDERTLDKPVSGIVTAINGNLGFKANAFNGVGFETVALKPANFSFYVEDDGSLTYMSRRQIVRKLGLRSTKELEGHPRYRANQVPLLPTNEMVVLFDEREQHRITSEPIYKIPDAAYSEG